MGQEKQLSEWVSHNLLFELREGKFRQMAKIPAEIELAEIMGVSRTILRDALSKLEQEGFISRRQGVGTMVNRHVLDVKTRMDLEEEFLSMIKTAGKTPKTEFCTAEITKPSPEIAKALKITPDMNIFHVNRLISADNVPAIFCDDLFPESLLKTREYDINVLTREPTFNFLERYCNTTIYMDLTEVRAVSADERVAGALDIPVNSPVLYMNEIGYDFKGNLILNSHEYYRDCVLHHTVLRKKI